MLLLLVALELLTGRAEQPTQVVLWLVLRYSGLIIRVITDSGIVLVTRIAGLLLSAIAVQRVANSVIGLVRGAR